MNSDKTVIHQILALLYKYKENQTPDSSYIYNYLKLFILNSVNGVLEIIFSSIILKY